MIEARSAYGPLLNEVTAVCGTTMGALHLTADGGDKLVLVAARGLHELWQDWIREIPIRTGIGAGVYGEAAVTKRIAIAPALEDSKFDGFRRIARAVGIGAAWSMPLLSYEGRVLGTLTTMYAYPRWPADEEMVRVRQIAQRVLPVITMYSQDRAVLLK